MMVVQRSGVVVEEERLIESSVLLVLIAQVKRGGLKGEHVGQQRTGDKQRGDVDVRHGRERKEGKQEGKKERH